MLKDVRVVVERVLPPVGSPTCWRSERILRTSNRWENREVGGPTIAILLLKTQRSNRRGTSAYNIRETELDGRVGADGAQVNSGKAAAEEQRGT